MRIWSKKTSQVLEARENAGARLVCIGLVDTLAEFEQPITELNIGEKLNWKMVCISDSFL